MGRNEHFEVIDDAHALSAGMKSCILTIIIYALLAYCRTAHQQARVKRARNMLICQFDADDAMPGQYGRLRCRSMHGFDRRAVDAYADRFGSTSHSCTFASDFEADALSPY